MRLLIKSCRWIITQDENRSVLRNKSIIVEDGLIREIVEKPYGSFDHVVDGEDKAAMPGLINTHTHLSMTLLRGYADDMKLKEWLETRIWPLERRLTGEICYAGALLGCLEMIKTGTTCFLDMYFHTDQVAAAASKAGLRGFVSHALIDVMLGESGREIRRLIQDSWNRVKALNNPRIGVAVSPHAPYSCSEETLLTAKEVAVENNLILHTHLAETRGEQARFEVEKGVREVEYLDRIGFLCPNLVAAHAVWLTGNELKKMGEKRCKVAHCPVSNMKLAEGGVAPLPEMFECGVKVGLGTDGPASNNSLDMFETMKICALIHKAHRWDPTIIPAQRALDLATREAAEVLNIPHITGSLEPGKEADILLIDLKAPNMLPIHHPNTLISNLVYSAKGFNVDTTIVNGNILMENGEVKALREEEVYSQAQDAVERLLAEA
ncbi:MAG: amidohydrolase, partial [Thermoproteota archaeon]